MKYHYLITIIFFVQSAIAQTLFKDKYRDCTKDTSCYYCGDKPASFKRSLSQQLQRSVEHGTVKVMSTSGRMFFEIQVDSTGHSCVSSSKDETNMRDVKDNIRRCINNLWDWTPAQVNQHPINSTVIVELHFVDDFVSLRFIKPGEIR